MRQSHYAAIWAANRIKELLALVRKEREQGSLQESQQRQWQGIARDMLYLVLSEPIDSILSINSNLHVCLVADDIKVMVHEAEVQRTAKKFDDITGHLSEMIEGGIGMKMSRDEEGKKGKTVAVASSRSVGIAVAKRMKKRGIGVKEKVQNLGGILWPGEGAKGGGTRHCWGGTRRRGRNRVGRPGWEGRLRRTSRERPLLRQSRMGPRSTG